MRFLLRPGWIALVVVVIGFAVAAFTLLAPWQFGREAVRDAQQQAIDASYATPPAPFEELVAPGPGVDASTEWRQATVTGTYLPEAEAVVRLRVVEGKPAVDVLTPLRTASGRVLLVDRGTVTARSGADVPAYPAPPAGPVTLTGRLRVDQPDPEDRSTPGPDGRLLLYTADSAAVARASGLPVEPGRLQLSADQPGVLTPVQVAPETGGAPFTNLSYALQWITFGVIALFALVYFVRLELLQRDGRRRQDKAELRRALAGDDG
ncbi:SURF1 family cytochrome oxidase biogenesis protein [Pseudonocardia humida]|uniref:SURF1-like protein n=1 Tax=Pseudonocardia humida TaxID=2800819 RepID=A0ABT0ZYH7_9PSEU|nr:SURF1 family cytochrome oxidase biogenesis protein [Pseudonocardia humida]MCO1655800.1 SURF1 family protein [Pseudonocardia humida]